MTPSDLATRFRMPPFKVLAKLYPIYPTIGIVSTFVGTGFAIALIPEDPFPAGALSMPAIVMSIGIAFAPVVASLRNPQTILRAEHILILSPIYWLLLDLIQGVYDIVYVTKTDIEAAFLAIGLFVCGIWIAALFRPRALPQTLMKAAAHTLTPKILFRFVLIFFFIGIFKFAYPSNFNPVTMFLALGANRWAAPWARGATAGAQEAILDHLAYFGYLLPTFTVMLWSRTRKLNFPVIVSMILTLITALFIAQGGNRRIIGVIFGAALLSWILEQQKLNIRKLFAVIISMVILLTGMQYMLELRSSGVTNFVTQNEEFKLDKLRVDDNFLRLAQIINIIPERHPFVYEKQIIFALIRPVPRALWPDKPMNPGFDLTNALGDMGLAGTSLTSTVIGELYSSFGWFGIFIGGWVYGYLAGMASLVLVKDANSSGTIVYSLSTMSLFGGMRSMIELVLTSYTLLAWMGFSWLLLRRQSAKLRKKF